MPSKTQRSFNTQIPHYLTACFVQLGLTTYRLLTMTEYRLTEQSLTEEEVNTFEKENKLSLPEAYKRHILKNNGGISDKKYFKGYGIAHFYPIKYGEDTVEDTIDMIGDILPTGFYPFAYDMGNNQFCIDLSEGDNGKIYFCAMGEGEIKPVLIANSFEEFMKGLSNEKE